MFITRLAALVAAVAIFALALPGVASANTGSVTCDSTGVVFTLQREFQRHEGRRPRPSTACTPGSSRRPKRARRHDGHVAGVFGTSTAGATWSGG